MRAVIGGTPPLEGETIFEKQQYLKMHRDDIRQLLMFEPRGHSGMSGSIVVPPCDKRADWGVIFIEVTGYLPMCVHGTISTATVLVETGMVQVTEPVTTITLEVPAGLVRADVEVKDGAAQAVTISNVPSFLAHQDVSLAVPGFGDVTVDIAYGGNFYAILPAADVGLKIDLHHASELVRVGRAIRQAVRAAIDPVHPENPGIHGVHHVEFIGPPVAPSATSRNMVLYGQEGVSRDPCGTGTSARMAQRFARGQQKVGEAFIHEGIIGSVYEGRITGETAVGPFRGVATTIRGRAFVTGLATYLLDPRDPFPQGFEMAVGSL